MNKKKKWYDTWWGLLWTLALVDANPGRGLQAFMEMDEALKDLPVEESFAGEPAQSRRKEKIELCPEGGPVACGIS